MKQYLLTFTLLFTVMLTTAQPFKPGNILLSGEKLLNYKLGVSIYTSEKPLYGGALDICLPIKMDSGFFSLGGFYGKTSMLSHHNYPYAPIPNAHYDYNWDFQVIGGRIAYHYDLLCIKHLDTYIGVQVSYVKVNFNYEDNYYTWLNSNPTYSNNSKQLSIYKPPTFTDKFHYNAYAGVRYDIFNILGIFGEAGVGMSSFQIGASLKI